jgi:Ca2+-transporting ATPase
MKKLWTLLTETVALFSEIDGDQRAASFAYYAFFSLFPLILLFVSIGAMFVESQSAAETVINTIIIYIPLEREVITGTISRVIKTRGSVGIIALLGLIWSSMRIFQSLVLAINRAWETTSHYPWWGVPLKNFALLGIVGGLLLLGIIGSMILDTIVVYGNRALEAIALYTNLPVFHMQSLLGYVRFLVPLLLSFCGFTLLYKLAPKRRVPLADVWFAALVVTGLLRFAQLLFIWYVQQIGNFNAIYGTLGSIIVLLMWIYISGSIIIFGGCLSVSYAKVYGSEAELT